MSTNGRASTAPRRTRRQPRGRTIARGRCEPFTFDGSERIAYVTHLLGRPDGQTIGSTGSEIVRRQVQLAGADKITTPFYESQWLNVCIRSMAGAISRVPRQVLDDDPEINPNAKPLSVTDPLVRMLTRRPNDHQTAAELFGGHVHHMLLDGEGIWFLVDAKGFPIGGPDPAGGARLPVKLPAAIISYRGSMIEIKSDGRGFPTWYRYPGTDTRGAVSRELWFPAHSVVHFRMYDPEEQRRGFGPTEALTRTLASEFAAERYIEGGLASGGEFGGYALYERTMSRPNAKAFEIDLNSGAEDPAARAKWKLIEDAKGLTLQPNTTSPKDMEYSTLRRSTIVSVCSLTGVPGPVVGVLSDVKFANFEWAVDAFWWGPVGADAHMSAIEDRVNNLWLDRVKRDGGGRYFLRFDRSKVPAMQARMLEKLKQAAELADKAPGMSYADAVDQVGMPSVAGILPETARVAYVPASTVTAQAVIEGKTLPPEPAAPSAPPSSKVTEPEEESIGEHLTARAPAVHTGDALFRHRRLYYAGVERRVLRPGELGIKRATRDWLRWSELEQTSKLRRFSSGQREARGIDESDAGQQEAAIVRHSQAGDFSAADLDAILLNSNDWQAQLDERITPEIVNTWNLAAADLAQELGVAALESSDPFASAQLLAQQIKVTEGVQSTLAKQIAKAWAKVLKDNSLTIGTLQEITRSLLPELTDELRRVFGSKDARASAIARTEAGQASNQARFDTLVEHGIASHTWVTEGDGVVREEHRTLDGVTVAVGSEFVPGLKFPNDPAAPRAGLVINCRCITLPEG